MSSRVETSKGHVSQVAVKRSAREERKTYVKKRDPRLRVLKRLANTTERLVSRITEGLASIEICLAVAPVYYSDVVTK